MKKHISLLLVILVALIGAVVFVNNKKISSVHPNTDAPLTQDHDRGDIANEKTEKLGDGWSRYTNTRVRLSFEFPSSLSLEPEGWYSYRDDVPSTFLSDRENGDNFQTTSWIMMPIHSGGMESVDEWLKMMNSVPEFNENIKYETVDGVKIAISFISPQEEGSSEYTEIQFFRDKEAKSIIIEGLSSADTDRIVKSIHFF